MFRRMLWVFLIVSVSLVFSQAFAAPFVSAIGDDEPVRWSNLALARSLGIQIAPGQVDEDDPYAPEAVMVRGPYRGQWIDLSFRRPALVRRSPGSGVFRVANVFLEGEFWIADIVLADVDHVFLQQHNFGWPLPAAHLDHLVQMRAGASIHLTSQKISLPTRMREIPALELSADSTGPKGIGYAGARDLFPRSAIVIRVTGMSERVPEDSLVQKVSEKDPKNPFFRFMYEIDDEGAEGRFLERVLRLSEKWGFSNMFNMACQNCTTTAYAIERFGFLDLSNYREPPPLEQWLFNKLPQMTAFNLRKRGLYIGPRPSDHPMERTSAALPNPKSGDASDATPFQHICRFLIGGVAPGSVSAANKSLADAGGVTIPPTRPR